MKDLEDLVSDLAHPDQQYANRKQYDKAMTVARRKYKIQPSKAEMHAIYQQMLAEEKIIRNETYEFYALRKFVRSASGVLVITIFTSEYFDTSEDSGNEQNSQDASSELDMETQLADRKTRKRFDCAYDCFYCPDEPGHPRSYLSTEPGVMRAIECEYDVLRQFDNRLNGLVKIGHTPDKLEILVLGGTWSSYPMDYRETFVRDIYYAANTWKERTQNGTITDDISYQNICRSKQSLVAERGLNEKCDGNRIIGVTLETRPDQISWRELRHFRRCGCTRVQIGVQHTDDEILRKINRRCYRKHTVKAIRLLKEAGFKVDIHLMPDLPGSDPDKDWKMFDEVLNDPDLQADQWKIYPTEVTPWTTIEKWYREGSYKPYADQEIEMPDGRKVTGQLLIDLLLRVKKKVHPWIRLNRVIRDIPERSIIGGNQTSHLRDVLLRELKKQGARCRCIRCREVRDHQGPIGGLGAEGQVDLDDESKIKLLVRIYQASHGIEYYISYETPDEKILFGQLRLRINEKPNEHKFPELVGCALIRELHVYGQLVSVKDKEQYGGRAQHWGIGRRLLEKAEEIAVDQGLTKIAVISGDGVKGYYRKFGYIDDGDYLVKQLKQAEEIQQLARQINDIIDLVILIIVFIVLALLCMSNPKSMTEALIV